MMEGELLGEEYGLWGKESQISSVENVDEIGDQALLFSLIQAKLAGKYVTHKNYAEVQGQLSIWIVELRREIFGLDNLEPEEFDQVIREGIGAFHQDALRIASMSRDKLEEYIPETELHEPIYVQGFSYPRVGDMTSISKGVLVPMHRVLAPIKE